MTKRELIEALEALDCADSVEVWADEDGIGSSPVGGVIFDTDTIYLEI